MRLPMWLLPTPTSLPSQGMMATVRFNRYWFFSKRGFLVQYWSSCSFCMYTVLSSITWNGGFSCTLCRLLRRYRRGSKTLHASDWIGINYRIKRSYAERCINEKSKTSSAMVIVPCLISAVLLLSNMINDATSVFAVLRSCSML